MTITITEYNLTVTVSNPDAATIHNVMELVVSALKAVGFADSSIKEGLETVEVL